MMRLALVYDVAYPFVEGGGQKRMFEVARRFAMWGWDVHWYSLKTWEGAAVRQHEGITYHGLRGHTNLYASDGTRSRRAALSFGKAILFANARFANYDIVWCGQWPYFHILALIARLSPWRTRLLVDWWEVWGAHWTAYIGATGMIGRALEWVLVNLVARTGHAVVISNQGLLQAVALGAPRQGLTYIPNGVNTAAFEAAPIAEGSVDITSFGRMKDHKNIDHIVQALKFVKENTGRKLTADIIGDGPELEKLKNMAATLGVADQICFHGRVDDARLASLLKRATIFVHPSTKEAGGSITMLEANACGLPIVCYRHPLGIDPSLILDHRTGLLVDEVSPRGLANGIEEMLRLSTDSDLTQDCLTHANDFDWNVIALRYRQVVTDLLRNRRKYGA